MSEDAAPPAFDAARLIADVRKGEPEAIAQAYQRVFGNDMGRLVLAHHLATCGVGGRFGPDLTDQQLRYAAGRHDAAIELATSALFDQAAIVVATLTDNLEGNSHEEPAFNYTPPSDDDFGF